MPTLASSVEVQIRSVLIATDLSPTSAKPLRYALAIARLFEAKFYLLHVVSLSAVGSQATSVASEDAWKDADQLENELIGHGAFADLPHQVLVRQGTVWEEVRRVVNEKQIDLLVIGTHGRGGLSKVLFGSVAEQIFRRAECPVLTVGPGLFQQPFEATGFVWPFLFATDFGSASLHALPYAVSFANRLGTKLVLLHVIPAFSMGQYRTPRLTQTQELARQNGLRRLRSLTEDIQLTVTPEFRVVLGSPSEKILQMANMLEADAIIMGLHCGTHVGRATHMPWETAYEVVRSAGCPVITVRN